jgi:superoxide reductase
MAMVELKDLYQTADWKTEKHAPVIEAPESVKKGEVVQVAVSVGKQIAHPNTTAHHIRWIEVYFHPDGAKFPFQVARFDFTAHGESPDGPDTSTVYANPSVLCSLKTERAGTIMASSYCNIHGLWESSRKLSLA